MRVARVLSLAVAAAVVLAACGKTGGSSRVAGVYHLPGSAEATSLELREDGTFSIRRDSCVSIGVNACGEWKATPTGAKVVTREGAYWPTPREFPSAVVRRISLATTGRELVVVGESDWAGTFTERWVPGRACPVCTERVSSSGEPHVVSSARACSDPLPACVRM